MRRHARLAKISPTPGYLPKIGITRFAHVPFKRFCGILQIIICRRRQDHHHGIRRGDLQLVFTMPHTAALGFHT